MRRWRRSARKVHDAARRWPRSELANGAGAPVPDMGSEAPAGSGASVMVSLGR